VVVLALIFFTGRNRDTGESQTEQVTEQEPVYTPAEQLPAITPSRELTSDSDEGQETAAFDEAEGMDNRGEQVTEEQAEPVREERNQANAQNRSSGQTERTGTRENTAPPVTESPRPDPAQQQREQRQAAERARLEAREHALDVAGLVASQSVNIDRNPELQGLLAFQAYKIHSANNGDPYDAVIYNGLYQAMKKLISPAYNIYPNLRNSIKAIEWLNRSASILTVSSDGSVKILSGNIANRSSQINLGNTGLTNECLAVSPDERIAAVGTNGGGLLFLELENNGTVIHTSTEEGNIVLFLQNL